MDVDGHNLLRRFGLRRVVNAAGTLTPIGAAPALPEVAEAVASVLQCNVDMGELQRRANEAVRRVIGAEAGCVTTCAAAGIALSIASAMTGCDIHLVERLPDTAGLRNEVIVQRTHMVNIGGMAVDQLVRLAGARVVEAGTCSETGIYHLEGAIGGSTCAVLHVVCEATCGSASLGLRDVVGVAKAKGVPVIVDAAGEHDLEAFLAAGADLVVYSVHKYLRGATAGLVVGRQDLVRACNLNQEKGIGRCMKVSKEGIMSALVALQVRRERDPLFNDTARQAALASYLVGRLNKTPGFACSLAYSPTGNPVVRVELGVDHAVAGVSAYTLVRQLLDGDPIVKFRTYHDAPGSGTILIDTLYLREGEEQLVAQRLEEALGAARSQPEEERLKTTPLPDDELEGLLRWPEPPRRTPPKREGVAAM